MALTIDATPGGANANSYATVAELDAYCEAHMAGAALIAGTADAEKKKAALIQATRQMDAYIDWSGSPTGPNSQALAWPRCGMYYPGAALYDPTNLKVVGSNEIPKRLKDATCEQARLLYIGGDRAAELDQQVQGLTQLGVGSGAVSLTFKGDALPRQVIAPSAWQFVSCWGTMRQTGRGGAVALQRT